MPWGLAIGIVPGIPSQQALNSGAAYLNAAGKLSQLTLLQAQASPLKGARRGNSRPASKELNSCTDFIVSMPANFVVAVATWSLRSLIRALMTLEGSLT